MIKVFCLVGPTGVGKTEVAIELAKKYDLDIISADSRQIYKYMDIGTAKLFLSGYNLPASRFKIHMIDIVTPDVLYSAVDFARDATKILLEYNPQRGRTPILVGGSGLYFKALFEPFFQAPARDPKLRQRLEKENLDKLYKRLKLVDSVSTQRIKPADRQRIIRALEIYEQTRKPLSEHIKQTFPEPEFSPYYVGLTLPRTILYDKINQRFDKMIEDGLVDEVKHLLKMGYNKERNALNGIGYQEIIRFLNQEISLMQAIYLAKNRSRQYAKRQITWFKKVEGIKWIEFTKLEETVQKVTEYYKKYIQSS